MKKINSEVTIGILVVTFILGLAGINNNVYAATSPTLAGSASYSVLGAETVTNTGLTTTTGDVGVTPGTSITHFPPGIAGGNNATHLHSNDASAIAARADILSAFDAIDQDCTTTYNTGTKDLVGLNLVAGVYCADAFTLTGTLTLSGTGVWIFKSAETLITSGTANIVGGDPCNVWWREVSSSILGTNNSLIGNILASTSITMATGATLNGRAMVLTGAVTLDANIITGPICAETPIVPEVVTPTPEVVTPKLPNTGFAPEKTQSSLWTIGIPAGVMSIALLSFFIVRKKRAI